MDNEAGRFTLIFLGVPGDEAARSSSPTIGTRAAMRGGRNFGHLAYQVDDIYATCQRLMDAGVTINRPPRDGRMAFVRTPDKISVELLQKGAALAPAEPWVVDAEHRRMVGWPDRRLLDLVGAEHPIIQAPMAGAGGVELCVAAIARRRARFAAVRDAHRLTRCGTRSARSARPRDGPLNLNFFCHRMPDGRRRQRLARAAAALLRRIRRRAGNGGALRLAVRRGDVRRRRGAAARRSSASISACPKRRCSSA